MMDKILTFLQFHLPRARPFLPYAGALALFALLGWLNGYFQAAKSIENPNLQEIWAVPDWTPFRAGPERQIFAALEIWDGKKAAAATKQVVQDQQAWRLVGTVRTGKTYTAVIQLADGGRIQRAVTGDTLANGEKILAVENGLLRFDSGGNQQEIKLFQQEKK